MLFLFLFFFIIPARTFNGPTKKFYDKVLANYSSEIPPWDGKSFQVILNISVPFIVLASMEENNQLVSYIAKINMTWTDPRLAFNTKEIGATYLIIPTSRVWIPTFEIYNGIDVHQLDMPQSFTDAEVYHDGTVSFLWKARFDTICQLTVDSFPFDSQFCSISFSCGLTPAEFLTLNPIAIADDFRVVSSLFYLEESQQSSPEWQLLAPQVLAFTYESEGKNQSLGNITYRLKRNPQFYIYFLILPTFIITLTCLASLLLPMKLEIGEKINLGLAGLLGLTFMLSVIVTELPRSVGMPLMGKWLLIQILFCVAAIVAHLPNRYFHMMFVKEPEKEKMMSYLIMVAFLLAHTLTSVLLFVFPPDEPLPETYKTL